MSAMVSLILSDGIYRPNPFYSMEYLYQHESESTFDLKMKTAAPRHFKTHLPFHFLSDCFQRSRPKVISVIRNPFDQLVSYYHFYRMYRPWGQFTGSWDEFYNDLYKKDKLFYGSYFDHVAGWWDVREEHKDHILYITYEDLLRDTRTGLLKVASFLGKDLSEEAVCSILTQTSFKKMKENSKMNKSNDADMDNNIVPFFRKGTVGDWMSYFSTEQKEEIYMLYKQNILSHGLSLDF